MNDTTVAGLDDFEAPATFPTEITVKGVTRIYNIRELPDADVSSVFTTRDAKGNQSAERLATWNARVIAKCTTRQDGTAITYEQARAMRAPLSKALVAAIMQVHGFDMEDSEAAIDDAEKN